MYFEIENTPEHIKKARRAAAVNRIAPKEELPRLVLAPFTKPPQVVFENVLIGTSCERTLEVFNPSKQAQQITLGRALPPGLIIHLPGEWLELEPETCYYLTLKWTPMQPTALRETVRFTNYNRGRYDIVVVLKSAMNIKGKQPKPKGFKTSPGKMKKKPSKRSPVAIYKKKSEVIYKTTQVRETVDVFHRVLQPSNKENISVMNDFSMESHTKKCPFNSPGSLDFNFDTSEVFANLKKPNAIRQNTYDAINVYQTQTDIPNNILKPSKKVVNDSNTSDLFDNLTFTPLKSLPKTEKLEKGPNIILSMNSDSELDDSLNMKSSNKENETCTISVTSQPPNKWLSVNQHMELDSHIEIPVVPNKKIPNTSSPKEMNSPNFSINTDFSRISELSFFPQRFSTEKKAMMKPVNETFDDLCSLNNKPSSDTYTKESPNTPRDFQVNHGNTDRPPHFFLRDQNPKICRQSLFREYQQQQDFSDKRYLSPYEHNVWQNDIRFEVRSPPRSITPPLQSIPEESAHCSDTHVLDRTDKQSTFTINQTFDKIQDRTSISTNNIQTWSKKAAGVESTLWKVPAMPRKSLKPKASIKSRDSLHREITNTTFECNKSINQNISLNHIGNVYSQSLTVDPFLSSTYYYDEEAVDKFEIEFKRWLNYILTPPADLDSNIEQKIDVGKAWIENRNKEVPTAPTIEQVCNTYHNSHRLESVRRSARALLLSPEMAQVFQKLNAQIEKKLIVIRTDRNLHLDVGLQKVIMELLLSYNPLWLRIGLEAIYGLVLPLKSNNDIEGLTTFIIQRMFKNPHLKNKHSKGSAPNMLLPAYMQSLKKFTLKKFFMLVFFLDQAKQRKLISHDPCLFCRNAICKESREIIIRFTRELIAGIGDITKHLRPLGYVVSHKQSYLDEYKYGVHNIAVDIRDGVRLTKVMEIILMKNGLLTQMRTPAISRLQKVHNVQVALNALKEANFVIEGDISANDIADGHREKTLSLLWQLIHVFRAPLFVKAANVIQVWWRKKYEVIVEKRRQKERERQKISNAASIIQHWWRQIQYNKLVEHKMQQVTVATVVIQKYFRMWVHRRNLRILKTNVAKIEKWYTSVKRIREAKLVLQKLRSDREELRYKSATIIQSYVRRWLCMKQYRIQIRKIIVIQSLVRRFLVLKWFIQLKKAAIFLQQKYRSKHLMKKDIQRFNETKRSAIIIQSYYRMLKERRFYQRLQNSVKVIENQFKALIVMRAQRKSFLELKQSTITIQSLYRAKLCRNEYLRQRNCVIKLQKRFRACQHMKKDKASFLRIKKATVTIQTYFKAHLAMKLARDAFVLKRKSAITIQSYYRSYLTVKSQKCAYEKLRHATIILQIRYRSLLAMRQQKAAFLKLKTATICIQRQYRSRNMMIECRENYYKLRNAAIVFQRRYKAVILMREQKCRFQKMRTSCVIIQNRYRAYMLGKQQRRDFLLKKQAAITIQNWYRSTKKGNEIKKTFQETKQACVTIQRYYKAYIIGKIQRHEYLRVKTATILIQNYYRSYIEMKTVRQQYIQLKTASVCIQRYYKSYLEMKKLREAYLRLKSSATTIQKYYKSYKETKIVRHKYCELLNTTIFVQNRIRSIRAMKEQRQKYLKLKELVINIQIRYRARLAMKRERDCYLRLKSAALIIQNRFRAQRLMKLDKDKYIRLLKAATYIQTLYRANKKCKVQRKQYLLLKKASLIIQKHYLALLAMRKCRTTYLNTRKAAISLQQRYRARNLMIRERQMYRNKMSACIKIQQTLRAYSAGKKQLQKYKELKQAAIVIQRRYRLLKETRKVQKQYNQLRSAVIFCQRRFRLNKIAYEIKQNNAASTIQTWYRSVRLYKKCRDEFVEIKNKIVKVQSVIRMHVKRRQYIEMRKAVIAIQTHYRSYRLTKCIRSQYIQTRISIIKVQTFVRTYIERKRYLRIRSAVRTIQVAYRLKKQSDLTKKRREDAALCIQKNVRRYIVQKKYAKYVRQVTLIQKIWRGKLVTRLIRCEFLQKKRFIVRLQSIIRGYLVRRQVQIQRENILKMKEEQRRDRAASKIQALFRGYKVRTAGGGDARVTEIRRRWRDGGLLSKQETLKERNEEVLDVLTNNSDIETVIRAFRSLELLTEVVPMTYNENAAAIVQRVYIYMSVTNRSISSIEVLKSAAAVLVNLARYRITGPKTYSRDLIAPMLKFMLRFSSSETQLFCILSTYLWLFAKYDSVREDLTQFLHLPENHRMLTTIKGNVERMKRMANNVRTKFYVPQPAKFGHNSSCMNMSICRGHNCNLKHLMPALEPDYGISRADNPRYFEDAERAINCLFITYKL